MTIYGRKIGMTRWISQENGEVHAVTVLQCEPNRVTRVLSNAQHGHDAVQVTFGKAKRLNKPAMGLFRSLEVAPGKYLREVPMCDSLKETKTGANLTVEMFKVGQKLNIAGKTIGKGFAGCVKRHNFSMQDATHGNSLSHRAPGSIGQCQDPGKVFKGKKMAGRMGGVQRTTKNLMLLHVDAEKHLLIVKGAVPGHKNGIVRIEAA